MIIVLKPHTAPAAIEDVKKHIVELGYEPRVIQGVERTVIAAVGDELSHQSLEQLKGMSCIENVVPIQKRYKLASREFHPKDSVVSVRGHKIGGGHFQVIAGPCSMESYEQFRQSTADLVGCGVKIIRGMAYKPRTSPYDFQGLGEKALEILAAVKKEFNVAVVTEILAPSQVEPLADLSDMLQIGARNSQNYHLLEVVAKAGKPVLLKRGLAMYVDEWLSAAEYLLVNGCPGVILCERGIRTFERATRNTLDLGAVAVAKFDSHLPVIVDPSHAAGVAKLVLPLAKAGIAAGADGLIIEAHPNPVNAMSDAAQQIPSAKFGALLDELKPWITLAGRELG